MAGRVKRLPLQRDTSIELTVSLVCLGDWALGGTRRTTRVKLPRFVNNHSMLSEGGFPQSRGCGGSGISLDQRGFGGVFL